LTDQDIAGSVLELLGNALETRRARESDFLARSRKLGEMRESILEHSEALGQRRFFLACIRGKLEHEYDKDGPPALDGCGFHSMTVGSTTFQCRTQKPVRAEASDGVWQRLGAPRPGAWQELDFLRFAMAIDGAQRKVVTSRWKITGEPEKPWLVLPHWVTTSEVHDVDGPGWRTRQHEPLAKFLILLDAADVSQGAMQTLTASEWTGDNEDDLFAGLPRLSDVLEAAGLPLIKTTAEAGPPPFADEGWRKTALEAWEHREPVDLPPELEQYRPIWERVAALTGQSNAQSDSNEPEAPPAEEVPAPKRRRGRPKGSKDSRPRQRKTAE